MRIDIKPNKNKIEIGDLVNDNKGNMYLLGLEASEGNLTLIDLATANCEIYPYASENIEELIRHESLELTQKASDMALVYKKGNCGYDDHIA
ncbi:hypothetical protein [Peptostreptococcus faecalis]|uniref:hypothetical protein n=1 Tax=Peptostreptococcus faecalis TaxID=2045015 RepID=UPI000C7A728E|nr:hypothetical protein [Peptostreptococcus faecalis]